jgi:transposase
MKRARSLVSAAEHSVGSKEAPEAARMELRNLLDDMDAYTSRLEELLQKMEEKRKEIPYIDKLMGIKGLGLVTVGGFIAEVGDIGRFDNPKQLQKLAGYAIVANDSGKHNGESRISYRGRKRLRYVLYEAAISLIGKNEEFRSIHEYYQTRKENPLKKMQSVVAVACKALRVFYVILTKGVDYDAEKLMNDIRRPQAQAA